MTERTWFTVVEPDGMLDWVAERCPERKLRLYAAACCRRVAHRYGKPLADALAEAEALADRASGAKAAVPRANRLTRRSDARDELDLVDALAERRPLTAARYASQRAIAAEAARNSSSWEERWFHALYLCDLIGNPFRAVPFAAAWRTDTVTLVAKQMYETRDFSGMPVLADALQEAGCDSADILDHCRETTGAHVRGCWVVDLVLGKG